MGRLPNDSVKLNIKLDHKLIRLASREGIPHPQHNRIFLVPANSLPNASV